MAEGEAVNHFVWPADTLVASGAAKAQHQTLNLDMKPVRMGTWTDWYHWTGGLNVRCDSLLRQSCCEWRLSPHNMLNLEENGV